MHLLHRLRQGTNRTDEGPRRELHWGRGRWLLLCRGQGQGLLCLRTRQLLRQGGSRNGVQSRRERCARHTRGGRLPPRERESDTSDRTADAAVPRLWRGGAGGPLSGAVGSKGERVHVDGDARVGVGQGGLSATHSLQEVGGKADDDSRASSRGRSWQGDAQPGWDGPAGQQLPEQLPYCWHRGLTNGQRKPHDRAGEEFRMTMMVMALMAGRPGAAPGLGRGLVWSRSMSRAGNAGARRLGGFAMGH